MQFKNYLDGKTRICANFNFLDPVFQKLTGGTVKGWSDLVGTLFQPPSEAESDLFGTKIIKVEVSIHG